MFRDELDLLEMRLEELDHLVDWHIVVEAGEDFAGRPKDLILLQELKRFSKWLHRLTVVQIDRLEVHPERYSPHLNERWLREHYQRDAMMATIARKAELDDTVLICDLDEIPSPDAITMKPLVPVGLMMRTAHSAVDWLYPNPEPGSVISPWSWIRDRSLSYIRDGRPEYKMHPLGGWHFSWLGRSKQTVKADVTCHLELAPQEFDILRSGRGYEDGRHVGVDMVPVDVDDSWPAYVRDRRCPPDWFRPR